MRPFAFILLLLLGLHACTDGTQESAEQTPEIEQIERSSSENEAPDYEALGIDTAYGIPQGLAQGEKAPQFEAPDHAGNPFSLAQKLEKGKVVIFFYRGGWCTVCARSLVEFERGIEKIRQKGATLVGIAPEKPAGVTQSASNVGVSYTLLPDTDLSLMKKFGVAYRFTPEYLEMLNNKFSTQVLKHTPTGEPLFPVPAVYVIGQDATIEKVFFNLDFNLRPTVDEIVEFL